MELNGGALNNIQLLSKARNLSVPHVELQGGLFALESQSFHFAVRLWSPSSPARQCRRIQTEVLLQLAQFALVLQTRQCQDLRWTIRSAPCQFELTLHTVDHFVNSLLQSVLHGLEVLLVPQSHREETGSGPAEILYRTLDLKGILIPRLVRVVEASLQSFVVDEKATQLVVDQNALAHLLQQPFSLLKLRALSFTISGDPEGSHLIAHESGRHPDRKCTRRCGWRLAFG